MYYRGLIEQFQIYDKALSQLDIRRVMLGFHPFGLQFNGYYKFCSYTTSAENQSADIKLSLPAGKKITIYWDDGTSTVVTGEVSFTVYSHTYADIGTYNLTVTGDYNDITYLKFNGDGSYGGDIKYLPNHLLTIIVRFNNTFYGDISHFSYATYVRIGGQISVTGDIQCLSNQAYYVGIYGFNTTYGDLAKLSDNITFFRVEGCNIISEYTGKTWTTNIGVFKLTPVAPGGLSSAEIDQLLIDLDNDLDWSGGGQIILTGANAPRTSASDNAVNNIIAEGGTVICND